MGQKVLCLCPLTWTCLKSGCATAVLLCILSYRDNQFMGKFSWGCSFFSTFVGLPYFINLTRVKSQNFVMSYYVMIKQVAQVSVYDLLFLFEIGNTEQKQTIQLILRDKCNRSISISKNDWTLLSIWGKHLSQHFFLKQNFQW